MSDTGTSACISDQFRVAVQYIQDKSISKSDFPVSPTYEQQLQIYGCYKQATHGDCNEPQPWAVQAQKRFKWEAWNRLKGMTKVAAMQSYVNELLDMANKFDVNALTTRGRQVVSKFYREIGVEPPAHIAAALTPTTPTIATTTPSTPSTPANGVAPSSSPSTPTSDRKTGLSSSGPFPPLPLPLIRPVDPLSPAPVTPKAAHHPMVSAVRGQTDEADKKLAELENQVLRLLAAKAAAPLDGGATPRITHQQNELRQILDQLELRERAREERVKRMEDSYLQKLRQLESLHTPVRSGTTTAATPLPLPSSTSSAASHSAMAASSSAAAAAASAAAAAASAANSGSTARPAATAATAASPFPLPHYRELQIGFAIALTAYAAYSIYQRYRNRSL